MLVKYNSVMDVASYTLDQRMDRHGSSNNDSVVDFVFFADDFYLNLNFSFHF